MTTASSDAARPATCFGLSPSGLASLAAVLAVLLVVSLPRLQGLARLENEGDACATAELLVRSLAELEGAAPGARFRALAEQADLQRALADGEWLEDGRLLRRHGYLFELCAPPAPLQAAGLSLALAGAPLSHSPGFAVRAWPWSGETGRTAFVASACGTVLAHTNAELGWSGLERRPEERPLTGWRSLP